MFPRLLAAKDVLKKGLQSHMTSSSCLMALLAPHVVGSVFLTLLSQINFLKILHIMASTNVRFKFSPFDQPKNSDLEIRLSSLISISITQLNTDKIIGSTDGHVKNRCNGVSGSVSGFEFMSQKVQFGEWSLTK